MNEIFNSQISNKKIKIKIERRLKECVNNIV